MIFIVKAFDKKQRCYVPHILSFIKNADSGDPECSNYFFTGEDLDYENVDFGTVKNMTPEKEREYEDNLIAEMAKQSDETME
jgi:hypothetical protein